MLLTAHCKKILVVVAAPVEETLWCGGYLLTQSKIASIEIASLVVPKTTAQKLAFKRACMAYGATPLCLGVEDRVERPPLDTTDIISQFVKTAQYNHYNMVLTHSQNGEYTSNRRHKEINKAVKTAIEDGKLSCDFLANFCYTDNDGLELPHPKSKGEKLVLEQDIWQKKYAILRKIYNYSPDSWEARATPHTESFTIKANIKSLPDVA